MARLGQKPGKLVDPGSISRLRPSLVGVRNRDVRISVNWNSVAGLVEASRRAPPSATTPVVLADAGVENVNAQVDDLITAGVLRRVLAFTQLKFSNSMIEAWWRFLKHQWLFLHSLDSVRRTSEM